MAGQAERLVDEIRARRQVVRQEIDALFSTNEVARRVRGRPVLSVIGAAVAGLVAGRFFTKPLVDHGKRTVMAGVRARAKAALTAVALAAVSRAGGGAGTNGSESALESDAAAGLDRH